MTMLLDGRLRDLATQTHLLETKVSSLGWMAGAGAQTLKSMTRAQAHLMLGELADVLQTVGNLIAAFGITDEEVAQAMDDCLERNRERGRL